VRWKLFFSSAEEEEDENCGDDDDYENFTLAKKNSKHFDFISGFMQSCVQNKMTDQGSGRREVCQEGVLHLLLIIYNCMISFVSWQRLRVFQVNG